MSECVEWNGQRLKSGYGTLWSPAAKRKVLAHRVAWEQTHGAIPNGMCVCHHCDNPSCVRISHLFIGTHSDNMKDCSKKGRLGGTFPAGEKSPKAKLSKVEVDKIRALRGIHFQKEIATMFGVTKKTIGRIQRMESWI